MKAVMATRALQLLLVMSALIVMDLLVTELRPAFAQTPTDQSTCTLQLQLNGAVGPATLDYFDRGAEEAARQGCDSILFLINTPGGNLQTTRLLVERILESTRPVLCLVWPPGGHAGSAGAIILQACHVTGAAPATNIGAATPITASGSDIPQDVRQKIIEDTKSWVTGLARLRGRNETFATESVTQARALDAQDAAKIGAIDTTAVDIEGFLRFAQGRPVKMPGDRIEAVKTGPAVTYRTDFRHRLLDFLTDPQFAYLLFLVSLALLYFEFTNPGTIVPGVLGTLGLIVAMIAFNKLDVWWGGVALIFLGVAFLIAEAFVPSFGMLGIGGLAALAAGSVLLYDPAVMGSRLPNSLIISLVGTLGLAMLALAIVLYRSRAKAMSRPRQENLAGREAKVISLESPSLRRGMLEVQGELWKFLSERDVQVGEIVAIVAQEGLVLRVK